MSNILQTDFVFNSSKGEAQIDQLSKKLSDLGNRFDQLGTNTNFGNKLNNDFANTATKITQTTKKFTDGQDALMKAALADIEGYKKENERAEKEITKSIEREAKAQADAKIREGKRAANEASKTVRTSFGDSFLPARDVEFDKVRANLTKARQTFSTFSSERLSAGGVTNLIKEITLAHDRARQLDREITKIVAELSNPTKNSNIKVLLGDLRLAEKEADGLTRKLSLLQGRNAPGGRIPNGQGINLSTFQKQNLSYQVNDVLTGIASGQPLTQIAAQQSGQIAQIFSPAQASALVAAYAPLVGILGAGAAAIALTYKITGDIRAEAEKRLKIENELSAAGNRQILTQREALKNLAEQRRLAEEARNFSQFIEQSTINDLEARRRKIEEIINLTPKQYPTGSKGELTDNPRFQVLSNELNQIDAQIASLEKRNSQLVGNSFNSRFENFKKFQESTAEVEKRRQAEFEKSVEKGKEKVKELGKTYTSGFSDLTQKLNSDNPFVKVFSEADTSLKKLREDIRGLPEDMQKAAIEMQQAINRSKLFEARVDNALSVFDLRETADKFRNPNRAEENKKFFDNAVQNDISRGNFFQNGAFGSYGSFIANKADGFDKLTDAQKRDIYEVNQLKNLSAFDTSKFGVNDRSLISRLANERVNGFGDDLSSSQRLQKQFNIVNSFVSTDADRALADKKILSLAGNLDPAKIGQSDRERIAAAAEREAERRSKFEEKSFQLRERELNLQERLITVQENLIKAIEKKGADAITDLVKIEISETGIKATGSAGTQQDVKNTYFNEAN